MRIFYNLVSYVNKWEFFFYLKIVFNILTSRRSIALACVIPTRNKTIPRWYFSRHPVCVLKEKVFFLFDGVLHFWMYVVLKINHYRKTISIFVVKNWYCDSGDHFGIKYSLISSKNYFSHSLWTLVIRLELIIGSKGVEKLIFPTLTIKGDSNKKYPFHLHSDIVLRY